MITAMGFYWEAEGACMCGNPTVHVFSFFPPFSFNNVISSFLYILPTEKSSCDTSRNAYRSMSLTTDYTYLLLFLKL